MAPRVGLGGTADAKGVAKAAQIACGKLRGACYRDQLKTRSADKGLGAGFVSTEGSRGGDKALCSTLRKEKARACRWSLETSGMSAEEIGKLAAELRPVPTAP